MRNNFVGFPFLLSLLLALVWLSNAARETDATGLQTPLTAWYVDAATGDDGNDCLTPASACLTVGGAVGKASAGDTIQIAPGTYVENLDINFDLAFVGSGMDATFLDGGQVDRVFIAASEHITLTHLTVQNGTVTGSGTTNAGGGIMNYGGLWLDQVRITQNSSQEGGGGIFTSGEVMLQNSEVVSNTSDGAGGGIYIWSAGIVTVTESLIGWNSGSLGGGVNNLGSFYSQNSTLQGNQAAVFGGGLSNSGLGTANLVGVTVFQNQTDGYGAGLLNEMGTINLTNVTVSGNLGNDYVGIVNVSEAAQMTILNSTIAENIVTSTGTRYGGVVNISGTISLKNTIAANNDNRQCLAGGTWTSLGYNLSSDGFCNFTQPGDEQNSDPALAPLADYGGPTWTHALYPGSPAIDTGTHTGCPSTDQRGVPRPFDGNHDGTPACDKGAVETQNQLTIGDVTLLEGNGGTVNAVFPVTLSPTSTLPVTVSYAAADGLAMAGSDYQSSSGLLTFDPGEDTQLVLIPVNGDTDDEPDENFFVHLSNASNADILDGQGEATIVDDDGLPSLTISDISVEEGSSGIVNALFTITLSPADTQEVMVDFSTADGTAAAGSDYTAASGSLTFDPGETEQTITVQVFGDMVDEGETETFFVNLSNAVNANLVEDNAPATILDDDTAAVSLASSQPVLEGDTGTASLTFTVTLSLPTSFAVTVDYYSQSGTGGTFALPGVDYEETSGTLTFAPGETEKTFTVPVYGDTEVEPDENFGVYLINAAPISIYGGASTGYILNDDGGAARVYMPIIVK